MCCLDLRFPFELKLYFLDPILNSFSCDDLHMLNRKWIIINGHESMMLCSDELCSSLDDYRRKIMARHERVLAEAAFPYVTQIRDASRYY